MQALTPGLVDAACASVGDADAAFRLHAQMVKDGLPVDRLTATTLINACSREILKTCSSQRRRQLVLLERAGGSQSLVLGAKELRMPQPACSVAACTETGPA